MSIAIVNNGQWAWWREGQRVVVGWMRTEPFGEDTPICAVRDSQVAGHLVDTLTTFEADPIQ